MVSFKRSFFKVLSFHNKNKDKKKSECIDECSTLFFILWAFVYCNHCTQVPTDCTYECTHSNTYTHIYIFICTGKFKKNKTVYNPWMVYFSDSWLTNTWWYWCWRSTCVVTWQWLSVHMTAEVLVWGKQPLLAGHYSSWLEWCLQVQEGQTSGDHMIFYLWLNSGMGTVYGEVIDVQKSFFSLFHDNS